VWPQCWDLQGPRGLEQRDLRNLNLGDLKKRPNGGVSPTPQKKREGQRRGEVFDVRESKGQLQNCSPMNGYEYLSYLIKKFIVFYLHVHKTSPIYIFFKDI
jgi:hypothetical protein